MPRKIYPAQVRVDLATKLLSVTLLSGDSPDRPISATAERLGVSRATFWRWRTQAGQLSYPGRKQVDRATALTDELKGVYYESRGNAAKAFRKLSKEGKAEKSRRTFQRNVAAIPKAQRVFALNGDAEMTHQTLVRLPLVGASQRNDRWQLDNRELDMEVLNAQGQVIRPWVVSIIDDATRVIPGYALCEATPTSTDLAMALASAILPDPDPTIPFCGIPTSVLIDNGADYLSEHFTQILTRLGILHINSPPYTPQMKGKVERWHQTMDQLQFSGLPGDTNGPHNRNGKLRRDARQLLSFAALGAKFDELLREYHGSVHSSLGMTPLARWNSDTGVLRTITEADLAPALLREDTRVIQREGVRVTLCHDHHFYTAPELGMKRGETVRIGYLPHDDSRLWVYDKTGELLCVAKPSAELTPEEREAFLAKRRELSKAARATVRQAREAAHAGFPTYTLPAGPLVQEPRGDASKATDPVAGTPAPSPAAPTAPISKKSSSDEAVEKLAFGLPDGEVP